MEYIERLTKVAVLGAAGKMGSGILLLTAMEVTDKWLQNKDFKPELYAIDVSQDALKGLMKYLETQVLKAAEKKMVLLRKLYHDRADLIENGEIVSQYVRDVISMVVPSRHMEDAYGCSLVFEAIKEDPDLKIKILKDIDQHSGQEVWFFTNTSSIPISLLNDQAQLGGRIVGFHFYNPPAVQKLVELIPSDSTLPELVDFAHEYASSLRKVVVPSNDFAGFIGNGHFMRDALFGIRKAAILSDTMGYTRAIWTVNRISQDFLLRPMGIFQLIDYVGVDVVSFIMQVMNPYLPDEDLHAPLLDSLLDLGIKGGQYPDGSQKDGMLKYERGRPVAVYNPETQGYEPVDAFAEDTDRYLGRLPENLTWKEVNFASDKAVKLDGYFKALKNLDTQGARLAIEYGLHSKSIGEQLVRSGVAHGTDDVNTVLKTGFFHAYGPVNDYFNS